MLKMKVDWFAFTLPDDVDIFRDCDNRNNFVFLAELGYDVGMFEEIPGRYFYNTGLTLNGYVNIYYNDLDKSLIRNTQFSRNYVFTGQGSTDLAKKINSQWIDLMKKILNLGGKITRLDLAIDDFEGFLDLEEMEKFLENGWYRSVKKTYNVVKEKNRRETKGRTLYIGKYRVSGSKGNYYARFYDKLAQYKEKKELVPVEVEESGFWQRYEISFTKKKAMDVVELMVLEGKSMELVYSETMKTIIEFLEFNSEDKNKSRWEMVGWWTNFIGNCEKAQLGYPERDINLGGLFSWVKNNVLPSLHVLNDICNEDGFDFFDLMRDSFDGEYSKKQKRLIDESRNLSRAERINYINHFRGVDSRVRKIR